MFTSSCVTGGLSWASSLLTTAALPHGWRIHLYSTTALAPLLHPQLAFAEKLVGLRE